MKALNFPIAQFQNSSKYYGQNISKKIYFRFFLLSEAIYSKQVIQTSLARVRRISQIFYPSFYLFCSVVPLPIKKVFIRCLMAAYIFAYACFIFYLNILFKGYWHDVHVLFILYWWKRICKKYCVIHMPAPYIKYLSIKGSPTRVN